MQTNRILWAALMGSVLLFSVLSFVLPPQSVPAEPTVLVVIAASAVAEVVLSFWLPARTLRANFASLEVETLEQPVPTEESSMFGGEPRVQKVLEHPGKALRDALPRYQAPFIMGIALSEAVAMDGFVLSHLGFPVAVFLPFLIVAVVLVGIRYPSEARVLAAIEAATGARLPTDGSP